MASEAITLQPTLSYQALKVSRSKQSMQGPTFWDIEIVHPVMTLNKKAYTKEDLKLAARSFSFRPINLNHNYENWLPFNFKNPISPESNNTLLMRYREEADAVVGQMQIAEAQVNRQLDSGEMSLLIDEYGTQACSCGKEACSCIRDNVTGWALA